MALSFDLLTPHDTTPTYLLTCSLTFQNTVVDPTDASGVQEALGQQSLDLIVLTGSNPETLQAAETLHARTGAPVLGGPFLRDARVSVARYVENDGLIGLGSVAQALIIDDAEDSPLAPLMLVGVGSSGVLLCGSLFTEKPGMALKGRLKNLPGRE